MARFGRMLVVSLLSILAFAEVAPVAAQEGEAIVYSAYRYGGRGSGSAIFTIVPGGDRVRLTGSRAFNLEPVWSPDRSRIAYVHSARPRNPDIWVMDADGSDKTRLTTGRPDDVFPQWSPDGESILWVKTSTSSALGRIFVMDADGTDKRLLRSGTDDAATPAWSPDGSRIAFVTRATCTDCANDVEIHVMDADGDNEVVLTDNEEDDTGPAWSPDGSRIVFSRSREDGRDLFTIAPDGSDEQRLTSLDGFAFLPRWSPDGADVAFTLVVDPDNFHTRLGVVDVESREARLLTDVARGGIFPDWAPGGDHIAFLGFHSGGYNLGVVGRDGSGLTQVTNSNVDEAWLDW